MAFRLDFRSSMPGSNDVPDEILARVMEEVKKQPDQSVSTVSEEEVRKQLKALKLMEFLKESGKGLDVSGNNQKDLGEFKVRVLILFRVSHKSLWQRRLMSSSLLL